MTFAPAVKSSQTLVVPPAFFKHEESSPAQINGRRCFGARMLHRDADVEQAGGTYVEVPFQKALHSSLELNVIHLFFNGEALEVGKVDIASRKATQEISSV